MSAPEGVASFFDVEAERYDREYEAASPGGRVVRARLAEVLRLLEGEPPGRVLDVGMGAGRLLAELAARGWDVAGLDASEEMVALARRRLPGAAAALVTGVAEELPFADGSFEAVAATGVLEYVDRLPAVLAEVARVLGPGGRAIISYPCYGSPLLLFQHLAWYPAARAIKRVVPLPRPAPVVRRNRIGVRRLEALVAEAGLRVEGRARLGARPLPASLAARADRHGGGLGRALATQVVIAARKAEQP